MFKKLILLLLLLCAIAAAQPNRSPQFVPGQIIAQERSGANPAAVSFALATSGGKEIKRIAQIRHHVIQVPEPQVDRIMTNLLKTGLFVMVERDGLAHATAVPNDPSFPSQWHLAKIQAPTAWNTTVGSTGQPIAVIDSGADITHPDLASRLVAGWNFLLGTSSIQDDFGHGTAVAGSLGAVTNNLNGVAGVTWSNPIMPLLVVDNTGYASYSNIASAITYAADHGARIVNISIAGSSASSTLQNAVNYAWNKGTVVFAAAGNYSTSAPYYPAACDNVVAVSATDENDNFAGFSNYGAWVDLSSPGNNILTTSQGGGYGYWSGTSFSSPVAAAVGALVLAVRPSLSASGLVSLLEQNSDDLGTAGFDQYFGYGRVNAAKAVAAAAGSAPVVPTVQISSPANSATVSGTVNVSGVASDSLAISTVVLYCDGQQVNSTSSSSFSIPWNSGTVTAGSHTLTVTATDSASNSGSSSVVVNVSAPPPPPTDTTPPSVQITSPANGAHVSGTTTISVSATDNVGVQQVTISIDNTQVYSGTTAPYSYRWNTKKAASGTHTITAKAWDAAGNSAATSITITK